MSAFNFFLPSPPIEDQPSQSAVPSSSSSTTTSSSSSSPSVSSNKMDGAVEKLIDRYQQAGCDINKILQNYKEEEAEHNNPEFKKTYIDHRAVVLEWMIDVCDYFNLHPTTTHGAIAYLDRLQPNDKFSRFEWQMIAISCIFISSKFNESEEDVPELSSLEDITSQKITTEIILNYELWALKKMRWLIAVRTPMHFISLYLSFQRRRPIHEDSAENVNKIMFDEVYNSSACNELDISTDSKCSTSSDIYPQNVGKELQARIEREMINMVNKLCLNVNFKQILASKVAAAVIVVCRELNDLSCESTRLVLGYKVADLNEVILQIKAYLCIGISQGELTPFNLLSELDNSTSSVSTYGDSETTNETVNTSPERPTIKAPSPSVELQQKVNEHTSPCSVVENEKDNLQGPNMVDGMIETMKRLTTFSSSSASS